MILHLAGEVGGRGPGPVRRVRPQVGVGVQRRARGLVPEGPLRLLAGAEALTGLVLVGWSSAFTFLHMQRYWHTTEDPRGTKGAKKNSSGSKSPS